MNKTLFNEEGFSLVELSIAAALAVFVGAVAWGTIGPNFMSNAESRADAYEACEIKREATANQFLDGSPTAENTPCDEAVIVK